MNMKFYLSFAIFSLFLMESKENCLSNLYQNNISQSFEDFQKFLTLNLTRNTSYCLLFANGSNETLNSWQKIENIEIDLKYFKNVIF